MSSPLVSTDWLADNIDRSDVVVVDCRWYLAPFDMRDPDVEYAAGHLPGAVQIRWDRDYNDPSHEFAGMLAKSEHFAESMAAAGIGDDSFVVAYDDNHVNVAARLWWALRVYGHDKVAVLDGGYQRWVDDHRALSTEAPEPVVASFTPRPRSALYTTKADVLDAIDDRSVALVDGRMEGAFLNDGGSVPGSVRLPGVEFISADGSWPTTEKARSQINSQADLSSDRIIAYCTGGVGACGTALAYAIAGRSDVSVYDGSWTEWGADPKTPKTPIITDSK